MDKPNDSLIYYEQLFAIIADELNVKQVLFGEGTYKRGNKQKHWQAVYNWHTLRGKSLGFQLLEDGKEVNAPKSLLALAQAFYDKQAA